MLEALTGFSHLHPSSSTVNCSKCMTGKLSLLCLKKYLNQMLLFFTVLSGTFYLKHLQILGIKTLQIIPCRPYLSSTPPAPFVNCLSCCISALCKSQGKEDSKKMEDGTTSFAKMQTSLFTELLKMMMIMLCSLIPVICDVPKKPTNPFFRVSDQSSVRIFF